MKEKLYYIDQYLKEFDAEVVSCTQAGKNYEIILDNSAFFPEGGGQPGDRGYIGDAKVIDTKSRDGKEVHICDRPAQGRCHCVIDWDFRFLNMQQHSGEHIFSGFTHQLTGFDNVGFHMGENEVTIDFNGYIPPETLALIEKKTNELIYKNIPIEVFYPSPEELKNYDYRSKKELEGEVRLVKVETGDLCACCGTHVARTGEIGMVKVTSCMNYKQGVRLTVQAGQKALDDYIEKNKSVYKISAALCAKPENVAEAVDKLKEKLAQTCWELTETKKELFRLKAESCDGDMPVVFLEKGSADDARICADMLADRVETAYSFCGNDKEGYKYAVVSRNTDVRALGKEMNAALSGRGGGKPECIQGSVACTKEEIIKFINNIGD